MSAALVGVLLVYSAEHAKAAVRRFASFMRQVGEAHTLVVVDNASPGVADALPPGAHLVAGDNTLREFSGWQAGIEHCRRHGLWGRDTVVVLANDTFATHNKFGPVTRHGFVRAFKGLLRHPRDRVLVGDVHGGRYQLEVCGLPLHQWVSTYLFAATSALLDDIGGIAPSCDLDAFFTGRADARDFVTGPLNAHMKRHVEQWLFDRDGQSRWYGADAITEQNYGRFVGKAKSIICEKWLSARTLAAGGKLEPVFGSQLTRQLRRLDRLCDPLPLRH